MKRNSFLLGITFIAGCAAVLLAAAAAPSGSRQWEYAAFVQSPGLHEWQTTAGTIRGGHPREFFENMGMPTGVEVDSRVSNLQMKILNRIGQDGWELTHVVKDSGREVYWFKRPK